MSVPQWFLVPVAVMALTAGCGGPENPPLRAGETEYAATGVIREFPVDGRTVVIRHDEILGYMPRMTMTFTVRDPQELRSLAVGDSVAFRLVATENDHWIDSLQRLGSRPEAGPASHPGDATRASEATLMAGDLLPSITFTDEAGLPGDLSRYRGHAIAITFLFTRCPLPDFCPRMSKHFARTRTGLKGQPGAPTNWMFLSLSFDPDADRPEVLAAYAKQYRGTDADRWLFASVPKAFLESFSTRIGLQVVPDQGTFLHNLRTLVIDTRGRIHHQFDGNEWTPEQLATALEAAARVPVP
ncbi:MAG: copper-binding protein [Verrucomicrobiales bacterium]|nr:copper-binding protein [Verrucomicrobiales bacterium]